MNQPNSSKTASSERKSSLDYPLTIASLALVASLIEWVMYVYTAHFSFATLLTRHGDKFNLPMRLAMSAWHVFEVYYVPMLGVVLVVTYLFSVVSQRYSNRFNWLQELGCGSL